MNEPEKEQLAENVQKIVDKINSTFEAEKVTILEGVIALHYALSIGLRMIGEEYDIKTMNEFSETIVAKLIRDTKKINEELSLNSKNLN